jgi:STAM-binding protein
MPPQQSAYSLQPPSSVNYTVAPQRLKKVICPLKTVQDFLQIAQLNTQIKVETCAILAGVEELDAYRITSLIVPQQEGHSDHCYMTNEMALFETQIKHGLLTIGWIHTHPQFDVFLSSVDLHNQLGYQSQLPEAIAIVFSPIVPDPKFKALRVKDSQVETIQKCKLSGFHEHFDSKGGPAWEECSHVTYSREGQSQVIDLR